MPPLSPEEKQQFLDAIRSGKDRAAAAKAIGTTGTRVRAHMSETSAFYDADFHAAYLRAQHERQSNGHVEWDRNLHNDPLEKTAAGYTRARYLSDADLDLFLEKVALGNPRDICARLIGTSLNQIDIRAARDEDFRERYEQALRDGHPNLLEKLRSEVFRQAFEEGNYQAVRDLLIVHDPDFEKLRTSKHEIGGGIVHTLQAALPQLSPETREQMIRELEERQQKELPQKVIDQ